MTSEFEELNRQLGRAPEDWSVRLRLIEEYVWIDDMDSARRLVRKAPDEAPLPPELQQRLHGLMTRGKDAIEREMPEPVPAPPAKDPILDAGAAADPFSDEDKHVEEEEEVIELVAANANEVQEEKLADGKMIRRHSTTAALPLVMRANRSNDRWENYDGDLVLVESEEVDPSFVRKGGGSGAPQKVSAFTFAILVHVVVLISFALVVVAVPRPKPPQLTVVSKKSEAEIVIPPKLLNKEVDPRPSAAAMLPANLVASQLSSNVSVPEFDQTQNIDATVMLDGFQPSGLGMSFAGEGMESSQVNFFGISSGGRRIVFIVEATPEMLVDEKGGMHAYDRVKNEIAALLGGLKSGTAFNLLLFDGQRLAAFREELVPAYPSHVGAAIRWLDPLNRDYDRLGLARTKYEMVRVKDDLEPIPSKDLEHYPMAIQKALEWEANTIFCITSGYERLSRSLSAEETKALLEAMDEDDVDPDEQKAWRDAVARTREWLQKENAARKEKGIAPKVVTSFNQLVREVTGATPPRSTSGSRRTSGIRRPEPYTPEDILDVINAGVKKYYVSDIGASKPSINMVLFLGEEEGAGAQEEHFRDLTRENGGKLKVLRGLAALSNVTGD